MSLRVAKLIRLSDSFLCSSYTPLLQSITVHLFYKDLLWFNYPSLGLSWSKAWKQKHDVLEFARKLTDVPY